MKNYFLGTSFLIDLMKNNQKAIQKHEEIKGREVTGTPCVYELSKFSNFNISEILVRNEVLNFNPEDAEAAGKIYSDLKENGKLIGEMDTIIAGMVKNRDLPLVTKDKDFKKINQIKTEYYD